MGWFVAILIQYGVGGMFVAAFLAGSFIPFSSEMVMAGLQLAGVDPIQLVIWGTLGNTLGSVFNYGLGHMGKQEWIVRYAKVKPDKLAQATRFVQRYGAWMGLLAWIPLLGSAITIALGLLRSNFPLTLFAIFLGKLLRYLILVEAVAQF